MYPGVSPKNGVKSTQAIDCRRVRRFDKWNGSNFPKRGNLLEPKGDPIPKEPVAHCEELHEPLAGGRDDPVHQVELRVGRPPSSEIRTVTQLDNASLGDRLLRQWVSGQKGHAGILVQYIERAAKRIYGVSGFRFYAIADGIKQLLFGRAAGIGPPRPIEQVHCSGAAKKSGRFASWESIRLLPVKLFASSSANKSQLANGFAILSDPEVTGSAGPRESSAFLRRRRHPVQVHSKLMAFPCRRRGRSGAVQQHF